MRTVSLSAVIVIFMAFVTSNATGHGGLFRGPTGQPIRGKQPPSTQGQPGGVVPTPAKTRALPGSGPQISFSEERWEFWWEYNHDRFVNLRQALRAGPSAGSGQNDHPFQPPKISEKRQTIVPLLVSRMLRDDDDQVRSAAAFTLGRLGDSSVIPYLAHLATQDTSLGVRTNAVVALGLSQSPRAIGTLAEILGDPSAPTEVRSFAATSIGLIGTPKCSGILKEWLDAKRLSGLEYQLRLALAYAIGLTRDRDNAPFVRDLLLSGEVDDYLIKALLIQALGQLGDRAANPILVQALGDRETQARRSAVLALGNVATTADRDVIEALERVARTDSDNQTRNFAYIALGRIASGGQAEIEGFLLDQLQEVSYGRRAYVMLALGLAGNKANTVTLLRAFTETKEQSLRGAIAVALGLLHDAKAVPLLHKALLDAHEPVYESYLALALGLLGDVEAAPRLLEIVAQETDVELLQRAIVALGLLGERGVIETIQTRFRNGADELTRASMAYGLGLVGDRVAIEPLGEIARDESEADLVRAFAVLAMGHLGALAPLPVAGQISWDVNYTLGVTFITELWNLL